MQRTHFTPDGSPSRPAALRQQFSLFFFDHINHSVPTAAASMLSAPATAAAAAAALTTLPSPPPPPSPISLATPGPAAVAATASLKSCSQPSRAARVATAASQSPRYSASPSRPLGSKSPTSSRLMSKRGTFGSTWSAKGEKQIRGGNGTARL
eukprot:361775-Chlamydomonas_euryale.AAC.3